MFSTVTKHCFKYLQTDNYHYDCMYITNQKNNIALALNCSIKQS